MNEEERTAWIQQHHPLVECYSRELAHILVCMAREYLDDARLERDYYELLQTLERGFNAEIHRLRLEMEQQKEVKR